MLCIILRYVNFLYSILFYSVAGRARRLFDTRRLIGVLQVTRRGSVDRTDCYLSDRLYRFYRFYSIYRLSLFVLCFYRAAVRAL